MKRRMRYTVEFDVECGECQLDCKSCILKGSDFCFEFKMHNAKIMEDSPNFKGRKITKKELELIYDISNVPYDDECIGVLLPRINKELKEL